MSRPLRVVGIGGTGRAGSTTERLVAAALDRAAAAGAETTLFASADLDLPIYAPERPERAPAAQRLIAAVAACDAVVVASPGYHGGVSGLVKNALDYLEDLRGDTRSYLDGRAVGLIVCAHGAQAGGTTLTSLRSIVHALRGWPTPLGLTVNSAVPVELDAPGPPGEPSLGERLDLMVDQLLTFARVWPR
ncbi:FMN reductase [Frankia sp. CcI49]|uniref:FMN reductase n=1 Tax=Parafrankia irregularis TaxID=795642 RepID=A0A0S4QUP4_9ACTN|nr:MULTISPECIES: NAD(P)H-dependent oxidoreductase [Frankiaceae]KPM52151.1 FMN reductase [Frankia sp. R43]MBE3200009.1 NAD(P)H-dependent oxidoreductase [Parafrankia sp. CH37]ONH51682.1 FMN reductase [Frankia sp. CcI49]CUU59245.1 FMN reductase [Parafrankia irregularis]